MRSRNLSEVSGESHKRAAKANSIACASGKVSRKGTMLSRMIPRVSQEFLYGRISGKYSSSLISKKAFRPSDGLPGFKSHFLNSSNRRSTLKSSSESVRQSSTVSGASVQPKRLANCTPRRMRKESSAKAGPT